MRLKIVSDPGFVHAAHVHIVNAETGEPVLGVRKVTWTCEAGQVATALVEMCGVEVDVQALGEVFTPEECRAIAAGEEPV